MGAPDSPVRHRIVSGAPPCHPPIRAWSWSTVGGFVLMWHRTVRCATGQSGAPLTNCSDFCHVHCAALFTVRVDRCAQVAVAPLAHRIVRWPTDSPVNYSGAAPEKSEAEEFEVDPPWCIGHCPVVHRTVRCARPGSTSVSFAPFF
jgi:hypothetical protein